MHNNHDASPHSYTYCIVMPLLMSCHRLCIATVNKSHEIILNETAHQNGVFYRTVRLVFCLIFCCCCFFCAFYAVYFVRGSFFYIEKYLFLLICCFNRTYAVYNVCFLLIIFALWKRLIKHMYDTHFMQSIIDFTCSVLF